MQIQTFTSEKEANTFIDTVELGDKGSIQYSDNKIIVFYSHEKSQNKRRSIEQTIDWLRDMVFHTGIQILSLQTDLEVHKENESEQETIESIQTSIKDNEKNLKLYKARLKLYENYALDVI